MTLLSTRALFERLLPPPSPAAAGRKESHVQSTHQFPEGGVSPPPDPAPLAIVSSVGQAAGSLATAAALACAGIGTARATLLIDLGGRQPRPTLLCTPAARSLEGCLERSLHLAGMAPRGGFCQVALPGDDEGFAAAGTAVEVARGVPAVLHVPNEGLEPLLEARVASRASAVLLSGADGADPPTVPPICLELLGCGLTVAVLERRLRWMTERRALFGALRSDELEELPRALVQWLAGYSPGRSETGEEAIAS